MDEAEKMEKIYEGISLGMGLTTQELYQMGLTAEDLDELVRGDTSELIRLEGGNYTFSSLDRLFMYGEDLRFQKELERATKVYIKCYEIDPTFSKPYFHLFFQSIFGTDNQKIFEFFDRMYHTEREAKFWRNDINCYLLLLNEIMELPQEYQEVIQNLKLEDVLVAEDSSDPNFVIETKARKFIFERRFDVVLGILQGDKSAFSVIVVSLCSKLENAKLAMKRRKHINKQVHFYLESREYEKVISILELPENEIALDLLNLSVLKLAKTLLEIKETGIIPKKEHMNKNRLFDAIQAEDYELALDLVYKHSRSRKIYDFIAQLLTDIIEEIKKINGKSEQTELEIVVFSLEQDSKSKGIVEEEFSFLNKKLVELSEARGIVILDQMNSEKISILQTYISSLSNVTSFSIGTDINNRIVLRYIDDSSMIEWDDLKNERAAIIEAYRSRDCNLCIERSLRLLSYRNFKPHRFDYKILGLAYLKKGNKNRAITYLTVTTELNNMTGSYKMQDDFSDLIAKLKGKLSLEDSKRSANVTLDEFEKEDMENDKIRRLQSISRLVVEENVSIDEACGQFSMSAEEILIVKLEFARFSYMKGDSNVGDQILKIVERAQAKSKTVLKLLEEIRRMKRLYVNRTSENQLVHTLNVPSLKTFK